MKFTKKLQLGLLFALYLTRSGRTTGASAAEGLGISKTFLDQVARQLKLAGVVKATKGPLGGYELIGEPTVASVFACLSPLSFLPKGARPGHEHRALQQLAVSLRQALNPIMNRKIKNVAAELVASDMNRMARISPQARTN